MISSDEATVGVAEVVQARDQGGETGSGNTRRGQAPAVQCDVQALSAGGPGGVKWPALCRCNALHGLDKMNRKSLL